MSVSMYPKSNLRIIGRVFKMHRISKGYSLRGIARSENIAHTVISDIESGKVYPNLETLAGLFKHVGVDFITDSERLKVMSETVQLCNEAIYYKDYDFIKSHIDSIEKQHKAYFYSPLMIDYELVLCAHASSQLNLFDNKRLERLRFYYEDFSDEQKQKFNLIYGVNHYKSGQADIAREALLKNLTFKNQRKVLALTFSYLAEIQAATYHIHSAIDYALQASKLHGDFANPRRKMMADFIAVRHMIDVNRLTDASLIINDLTLSVAQYASTDEKQFFYFIKSYLLNKQGKVDEALSLVDKHYRKINHYYLYKAYMLYDAGRTQEALEVLEASLKDSMIQNDPIYRDLNRLAIFYVKKNYQSQEVETLLNKLLDKQFKLKNHMIYLALKRIALDYYEHINDYKRAYAFACEYIEYMSRH